MCQEYLLHYWYRFWSTLNSLQQHAVSASFSGIWNRSTNRMYWDFNKCINKSCNFYTSSWYCTEIPFPMQWKAVTLQELHGQRLCRVDAEGHVFETSAWCWHWMPDSLQCGCILCEDGFSWRLHIIQDNRIFHMVLMLDGGYFCLPSKAA